MVISIVEFDCEKRCEYRFVIFVEDGGYGCLVKEWFFSYCVLKVIIEDVNDNYFFFNIKMYMGSVLWDVLVGILIMIVYVLDFDFDENRKVEYYLNFDDLFKIFDLGVILIKVLLEFFIGIMIILLVVVLNMEFMIVGDVDFELCSVMIEIYILDL